MPRHRPAFIVHERGFTLVELMITIAIVAILAAVAYPAYTQFVQKGRRAEAKAALMDNMQLFERHYAQINSYASTTGTPTTVWAGYKNYSGDKPSGSGYTANYSIAVAMCPNYTDYSQCIELRATPSKGDSTCNTLVYRSTGEKLYIPVGSTTPISPAPTGCW